MIYSICLTFSGYTSERKEKEEEEEQRPGAIFSLITL